MRALASRLASGNVSGLFTLSGKACESLLYTSDCYRLLLIGIDFALFVFNSVCQFFTFPESDTLPLR